MTSKYFVVGMPKAGTSSIASFFKCGGYQNVSHQKCGQRDCAECIWRNLQSDHHPFRGCDAYSVYAQLDVAWSNFCFFPQRNLSLLHETYPQSIFILNTRDEANWVRSVDDWGDLRNRLSKCKVSTHNLMTDSGLVRFYKEHNAYVRDFAKRTGHALIDIDIEKNTTTLVAQTGISSSCFVQKNRNSHLPPPSPVCYVGDSLLRYLWCWREYNSITDCKHQADKMGAHSRFFWKPTLRDVKNGSYTGCHTIVWDNLFHQVRTDPQMFENVTKRVFALKEILTHLQAYTRRVIFYVAQQPKPPFRDQLHGNVTMMDAWSVDNRIANHQLSSWSKVRADLYTMRSGTTADGRHYDEKTVAYLSRALGSLIASRA